MIKKLSVKLGTPNLCLYNTRIINISLIITMRVSEEEEEEDECKVTLKYSTIIHIKYQNGGKKKMLSH